MRGKVLLAAGITAVAAFAAVGFGAFAAGSGGGDPPATGASVAPADSVAFVSVDSDLGSSQWQTLNGLLAKLPGGQGLVSTLEHGLQQRTGLSWADDVQPALGPELDVVLLPATSGGKPEAVLLTQPNSEAKLQALLAKVGQAGGPKPLAADVGGWTAISESQAALDAVTGASSRLADSSTYQAATARLAGNALVTAYANGVEAKQLVSGLGVATHAGDRQLVWASGDVVTSDGGIQIDGYFRSDGGSSTQPYASQLVSEIPSGALAVADFQAKGATGAQTATSSPLGALQSLATALDGETAVYVSPGSPFPAVTLVTRSSDPQAVVGAIHDALTNLGASAGTGASGSFGLGSILGALQLSHAVVGKDVVVSTSQQAVTAFAGAGQKLADDEAFQQATAAAGMPEKTTGFVYVNLKEALPLLQGLASLAGGSAPGGDLSALRSLTAFGSGATGGVSSFRVFLDVQ